jgi:hypothetical protein
MSVHLIFACSKRLADERQETKSNRGLSVGAAAGFGNLPNALALGSPPQAVTAF